jgi:chromosome segregation ATPase
MTATADVVPALDKRRSKWLARVQAAVAAEAALAVLDTDLDANALQCEANRAALAAAITHTAELKKEIKALTKQRKQLRADRTGAKRVVKDARCRAKVTEKKFDKALIADMLQKAKTAALAANGAPPASRTRARTPAKAAARRRTPASVNGRSARA